MKKTIKTLLIMSILGTGTLFAQQGDFNSYKQDRMSNMKAKMECFNQAQTQEEFKKCKTMFKGKKRDINEIKSKILSKLDERIKKLEASKQCVSAAQDHNSLKECRPERKGKKGFRKSHNRMNNGY